MKAIQVFTKNNEVLHFTVNIFKKTSQGVLDAFSLENRDDGGTTFGDSRIQQIRNSVGHAKYGNRVS